MPQRMNPLKYWLMDWAEWYKRASDFINCYQEATAVYRAMVAPRITEWHSSVPRGAIPPRNIEVLCRGMNELKAIPELTRPICVMQQKYLCGSVKKAADFLEWRPRTVYDWTIKGENAMRNWLREQ